MKKLTTLAALAVLAGCASHEATMDRAHDVLGLTTMAAQNLCPKPDRSSTQFESSTSRLDTKARGKVRCSEHIGVGDTYPAVELRDRTTASATFE